MIQKSYEGELGSHKKTIDKSEIKHMILDGSYVNQKNTLQIKSCKIKPYIKQIYYQGNIDLLNKHICAIVGPRRISQYAQDMLQKLFEILRQYNVVTISGAADGVDTLAHTLSCNYAIPTIAVLGGGIDYYYTTSKRGLLEKIIAGGGLILSEYENAVSSRPYMFPARNRIIAGYADAVFIPEAQKKSGSLITATYAYTMNIPVYAPMQNIFYSNGFGTNQAIVEGVIKPLAQLQDFMQLHFSKKINTIENDFDQIQTISHTISENIITDSNVVDYLVGDMQKRLFD